MTTPNIRGVLPAAADFPAEVVTRAIVRDVDLGPGAGVLALITLDNGHDHTKPNTFGPQGLLSLNAALDVVAARAAAGPISRGSRYAPPQPGTRPRKHSGKATIGTPEEIVR